MKIDPCHLGLTAEPQAKRRSLLKTAEKKKSRLRSRTRNDITVGPGDDITPQPQAPPPQNLDDTRMKITYCTVLLRCTAKTLGGGKAFVGLEMPRKWGWGRIPLWASQWLISSRPCGFYKRQKASSFLRVRYG